MKTLAFAACLVVLVVLPSGLCSVKVATPSKSSQNVRITVLLEGKPSRGAKVEVYSDGIGLGQEAIPLFSLITDDEGIVVPPRLPRGSYHIVASAEPDLTADLYLDVLSHASEKVSSFSMNLVPTQSPTWERWVADTDRCPLSTEWVSSAELS